MNNRPTLEDAAREILRIAVREQHLKEGDGIQAQPVVSGFSHLPWHPQDLPPALAVAQHNGWITESGQLTAAGVAAALI